MKQTQTIQTTPRRLCPVCGSDRQLPWMQKLELRLGRCQQCSMIFAAEPGQEFARGAFYETVGSAFYGSEEKLAGDYSPVRYEREIRLLSRFCRHGRILDIGCSTGGFLYHLQQRFPGRYAVVGTDVATGALDIAEQHQIPVRRQNFLTFSQNDGPFDAVTFWAVLEHVADPGEFLRQAQRLLAPGGLCFVLVPNIRSLAVRLLGRKYRYILPQHLNYFSHGTLERLVQSCGLDVVHASTTHFNPIVILQDARSRSGIVADRERARLLTQTNALKTNPLMTPLRCLYKGAERILAKLWLADNLVAVARKP